LGTLFWILSTQSRVVIPSIGSAKRSIFSGTMDNLYIRLNIHIRIFMINW